MMVRLVWVGKVQGFEEGEVMVVKVLLIVGSRKFDSDGRNFGFECMV